MFMKILYFLFLITENKKQFFVTKHVFCVFCFKKQKTVLKIVPKLTFRKSNMFSWFFIFENKKLFSKTVAKKVRSHSPYLDCSFYEMKILFINLFKNCFQFKVPNPKS